MASQKAKHTHGLGSAEAITVLTTLAAPFNVLDETTGLGGATRGVRCETDGTLRCKKLNNDTVDLPFKAGETQFIIVQEITSVQAGTCLPITLFA